MGNVVSTLMSRADSRPISVRVSQRCGNVDSVHCAILVTSTLRLHCRSSALRILDLRRQPRSRIEDLRRIRQHLNGTSYVVFSTLQLFSWQRWHHVESTYARLKYLFYVAISTLRLFRWQRWQRVESTYARLKYLCYVATSTLRLFRWQRWHHVQSTYARLKYLCCLILLASTEEAFVDAGHLR